MRIGFRHGGRPVVWIEAAEGERLLDVARRAGQPLEGTCGGDLACATCHVRVPAQAAAALPEPGVEEEELLDLVPTAGRSSRLACQIRLVAPLDGTAIEIG